MVQSEITTFHPLDYSLGGPVITSLDKAQKGIKIMLHTVLQTFFAITNTES